MASKGRDFRWSDAVIGALIFLMGLPAACAAEAQEAPCMGRADAIVFLYQTYGESLVGEGVTNSGLGVLVFANPDTRTFTMTAVQGTQLCLSTFGTEWVSSTPLPVGEPA